MNYFILKRDAAQMDAKLLEKIEELTLHLIAQEKKIAALEAEVNAAKLGAK